MSQMQLLFEDWPTINIIHQFRKEKLIEAEAYSFQGAIQDTILKTRYKSFWISGMCVTLQHTSNPNNRLFPFKPIMLRFLALSKLLAIEKISG
jgi:hypothetical protein